MAGPQGMIIDAVFGSEAIDSSGEILDVAGADLSNLEQGMGQLNYEHRGEDEQGASANDWVGRIVCVKKIFKESDCDSDRQRKFWKEIELPFIYGICRLYDAAGHRGAQALAAIIRDHHANGEKILWRYSVEGTTLKTSADKKTLQQTVIYNVAMTRKPCNRTAETGILSDPQAPDGFEKSPIKVEKDFLEEVLKRSEQHFHPNATPLGAATYIQYNPEIPAPDLDATLHKMEEFSKALTGGSYNAAPGTLTGGAALQREDLSLMRKWSQDARKALTKWDGKADLKAHLKSECPEASDHFIDRFADLVDKYQVGKKDSVLKLGNMVQKHEGLVRRFEAMTVELKKASQAMLSKDEKPRAKKKSSAPAAPAMARFMGKGVKPGVMQTVGGGAMDVLHVDPTHVYAVPAGKAGKHTADELKKIPRRGQDKSFYISQYPEAIDDPATIDDRHTTHYNDEKQKKMVHGMDFNKPGQPQGPNGEWRMGAHAPVYVKHMDEMHDFPGSRREVVFHNLARDFFGMGDHVPTTAHMIHPKTGEEMAAVEGVRGRHPSPNSADDREAVLQAGKNGDLDKMALMDHILGNNDRHGENWMLDHNKKVKLIDHESTFSTAHYMPHYIKMYHRIHDEEQKDPAFVPATNQPVSHAAQMWLHKLDASKLAEQMKSQLVPDRFAQQTIRRLMAAKAAFTNDPGLDHHRAMKAIVGA